MFPAALNRRALNLSATFHISSSQNIDRRRPNSRSQSGGYSDQQWAVTEEAPVPRDQWAEPHPAAPSRSFAGENLPIITRPLHFRQDDPRWMKWILPQKSKRRRLR